MKIKIDVITNSKQNKVEYNRDNNLYKVRVSAVPEKGKANQEVIKILAEYFKTKRNNVKIISGTKSSNKIIEILDNTS